jgi:hypothetical protein
LPPHIAHNETFVLRLARAAREAWAIEVPPALDIKADGYLRAYHLDEAIRKALEEKFAADPSAKPALAPAPTPPTVVDPAEKREALIGRRAEHARQMLLKNERKAKAAAKLVQKWRAKVRYYDGKIAAKRGGK